jgi:hypothetical protein
VLLFVPDVSSQAESQWKCHHQKSCAPEFY